MKPVTWLDYISRDHDIEYIKPNNQKKADDIMVKQLRQRYWYMPQVSALARLAFTIKDIVGAKKNDKTDEEVYKYAKQILENIKQNE